MNLYILYIKRKIVTDRIKLRKSFINFHLMLKRNYILISTRRILTRLILKQQQKNLKNYCY